MNPLSDTLDISAVTGATWDVCPERSSQAEVRQVERARTSSTFVVNLPKQVTIKEVRELTRDLKRELSTDQPEIILDLSDVKEMDTVGLDLLLDCLRETLSRDGTISLRGISPEAATILELTGVDRVLSMFSESSEAIGNSGSERGVPEGAPPEQETLLNECFKVAEKSAVNLEG